MTEDGARNMGLKDAKARKIRAFICLYNACFVFELTDLEGYKGKPVRIKLEDDYPIFRHPYKLNLSERNGVKLQSKEMFDTSLVEL